MWRVVAGKQNCNFSRRNCRGVVGRGAVEVAAFAEAAASDGRCQADPQGDFCVNNVFGFVLFVVGGLFGLFGLIVAFAEAAASDGRCQADPQGNFCEL